ncbi:RNA polymerase subunit sigma-24 [bacterium]|nr:MAG: RNA polymerase subunit sigma-24 [bacterium]
MIDPGQRPADRQALSDEDLMLRVQAGEKACFDLLVQRYRMRLFNYLLRLVRDPDLAEELAQDAFVRAYVNADKYRTIARFSTWLYTIATNLVRNRYRQKKRRPPLLSLFYRSGDGEEEMVQDIADGAPNPEDDAVASDLNRVIAEATSQIPERYREPFVLREVNQLSYEEIAAVTGLKLGTVRSRINRARNHFRKIIEPLLEDPSPSPAVAPTDQ